MSCPNIIMANTTFCYNTNATALSQDKNRSFIQNTSNEDSWINYMTYILCPLLLVVGLCGNIMTLLVTRNKYYRRSSHGIYLTAIACADITFLLVFPFKKDFVHELFGRDVRTVNSFVCKSFFFVFRACRLCSSLFVAVICVERFVAVWFPLRIKHLSTRRAALTAVCCIVFGTCTLSAIWAIASGIKQDKCTHHGTEHKNKLLLKICSVIGMTLRSFVPTIVLLLLTPVTVSRLLRHRSARRTMSCNSKKARDETARTSMMLISVIFAYIALITSFCLLKNGLKINGIDIVTSKEPWAKTLFEFSQLFEQLNAVVNFILYALVSTSFRKYLIAVFKPKHTESVPAPTMSIESISTKIID